MSASASAAAVSAPSAVESTIPWVEKYRPSSLNDVIAQADIVGTSESGEKKKNTCVCVCA